MNAIDVPVIEVALKRPDPPAKASKVERIMLELRVDEHRCLSCGGCVSVCPRMQIPVSRLNSIEAGVLCRGCGLCVRACPVEALSQVPVPAPPRSAAPPPPERRIVAVVPPADRY
jgi:ferredoxin